MTSFLTLDSVSVQTPERETLFQNLTFSLGYERVGLVGRNGCGKSTLFRIIAGRAEPFRGTIQCSGSIGILHQEWPTDWTLAEGLGVVESLARFRKIVDGVGSTDDFDQVDWSLESRIASAFYETGLNEMSLDRLIETLSGGERVRLGIARLLIEKPDVILLDEPTNNLDAIGRDAIQKLVRDWHGGVLVASHDRHLLDAMDRIVEISSVGIRNFGGNWSDFVVARDADRVRAEAKLEAANAAVHDAKRAAQAQREAKDRRDKAGRAFAAKGSEPKILLDARANRSENSGGRSRKINDRLIANASAVSDIARSQVEILTPMVLSLPKCGMPSGAEVLALDDVEVHFGNRCFGPWSLHINGPERVALTGANGVGKTTLLKIASGMIVPSVGHVRRLEKRVVMLDQHVAMLDHGKSIVENVRILHPALTKEEAYAVCARFAFRNRDAQQIVRSLSGGERLRAGLAAVFAGSSPPWLIILDEPTNHLDIETVEHLENALRDFDGALLVVSHDSYFLDRVGCQRFVELSGDASDGAFDVA